MGRLMNTSLKTLCPPTGQPFRALVEKGGKLSDPRKEDQDEVAIQKGVLPLNGFFHCLWRGICAHPQARDRKRVRRGSTVHRLEWKPEVP